MLSKPTRFLSERYQFLTFGYTGGSSITYSADQLRRELQSLRDRLDPEHEVPAWDRTILVGHSMGGLLCKMMVQDSGSKLWDLMARRPFERLAGPTDARDLLAAGAGLRAATFSAPSDLRGDTASRQPARMRRREGHRKPSRRTA